ncbi:hypothetical protein NQ317_003191, partial [Molorchus minor]
MPNMTSKTNRDLAIRRMNEIFEFARAAQADISLHNEFVARYENIEKIVGSFEAAHERIIAKITDEVEIQTEDTIRKHFDTRLYSIKAISSELTEQKLTQISLATPKVESKQSNIKLPKINLPVFDGSFKMWHSFFDLYNTLVHKNQSLTKIEKFQYLLTSLSNEPLSLIKSFPLSENNYESAYETLVKRYQNKRKLAFLYWEEIVNAKLMSESCISLRKLLDIFNENLAILDNLNLPIKEWNFVLFHLLLTKLNKNTRQRFELENTSVDIPSFETLKHFVEAQCHAFDFVDSQVDKNVSSTKRSPLSKTSSLRNFGPKSFVVNTENSPNKCILCNNSHALYKCPSFIEKSPSDRYTFVRGNNTCLNCLSSDHFVINCRCNQRCRTCGYKHHTLLHYKGTQPKVDPAKPSTSNATNVVPNNVSKDSTYVETRLWLDSSLRFTKHANHLIQKSYAKLKMLYIHKDILSTDVKLKLSDSLILSSLSYCDMVYWPALLYKDKESLQKVQNACIRFSYNIRKFDHISPSFLQSKWLTLNELQVLTSTLTSKSTVLLSTALVEILDSCGNYQPVRALIDQGSQANFITERCLRKLGLSRSHLTVPITGINHMSTLVSKGITISKIKPIASLESIIPFEAIVIPSICENLPSTNIVGKNWEHISHLKLADPDFQRAHGIDILVGAEIYPFILQDGRLVKPRGQPRGQPSALNTIFGWVLTGKIDCDTSHVNSFCVSLDSPIDQLIKRFWEIEEIPQTISVADSPENLQCEEIFKSSFQRENSGRYIVKLPFKGPEPMLGNSRSGALRRLLSLERRFTTNPELGNSYKGFMQDYLNCNHMSLSLPPEDPKRVFYIPHHCVLKPDSLTTKIR